MILTIFISAIKNNKFNIERNLSPKENIQIRIPVSNINSKINNSTRNKKSGDNIIISCDVSTIINNSVGNLTV
jgi:hypothetical protein